MNGLLFVYKHEEYGWSVRSARLLPFSEAQRIHGSGVAHLAPRAALHFGRQGKLLMNDVKCAFDSRTPITVLVAVAVRLYREGLATTLAENSGLRIEGVAGTAAEAESAAFDIQPQVIIVDVSFKNAGDMIGRLRLQCTTSRILALAVGDEITSILSYVEAGAHGFVTSSDSVADLVRAIEKTMAGELQCSPRIAAQLLQRALLHGNFSGESDEGLTGRESQVFSLVRQGRSNKEIARALSIAEATVKNHVHHLLEKLHVATRAQAIAAAGPIPLAAVQPLITDRIIRSGSR